LQSIAPPITAGQFFPINRCTPLKIDCNRFVYQSELLNAVGVLQPDDLRATHILYGPIICDIPAHDIGEPAVGVNLICF
jgi:hypothetical protein